jgi:5,5'-dehydrodivanillate O-demethylase
MPAERHGKPELVRIAGYPLHEYSGLIFAYLGEGEPPPFDLPRKDALDDPAMDISLREDVWDCNWLQQAENSLDATHVSYVHRWPTPTRLGAEIGATPPELEYVETDAGIRQTAIRPNGVRISNWTFPNNNNVLAAPPEPTDPWINVSGWGVPIDDENTLRFVIAAYPGGETGERLRRNGGISTGHVLDYTKILFEDHQLPDVGAGDRITAQDYAAVRGQGVIHDRSKERLGASDAGIALLRRIIFRELDAIRTGKPAKRWAKIAPPEVMQRLEPVS